MLVIVIEGRALEIAVVVVAAIVKVMKVVVRILKKQQ